MIDVLGVDLSLRNTGLALLDERGDFFYWNVIPAEAERGVPRALYIVTQVVEACLEHGIRWVCLEGYAMGAKGRVFDIAEAGGALKHELYLEDINVVIVPPKTLKKWHTDNGNANKEMMAEAAERKWGIDTTNMDDNAVDACCLVMFGHLYLSAEPDSEFRSVYGEKLSFIHGRTV